MYWVYYIEVLVLVLGFFTLLVIPGKKIPETSKSGIQLMPNVVSGKQLHLQKRISDFGPVGAAGGSRTNPQLLTRSNSLSLRQLSDSLNNLFHIQQSAQRTTSRPYQNHAAPTPPNASSARASPLLQACFFPPSCHFL